MDPKAQVDTLTQATSLALAAFANRDTEAFLDYVGLLSETDETPRTYFLFMSTLVGGVGAVFWELTAHYPDLVEPVNGLCDVWVEKHEPSLDSKIAMGVRDLAGELLAGKFAIDPASPERGNDLLSVAARSGMQPVAMTLLCIRSLIIFLQEQFVEAGSTVLTDLLVCTAERWQSE